MTKKTLFYPFRQKKIDSLGTNNSILPLIYKFHITPFGKKKSDRPTLASDKSLKMSPGLTLNLISSVTDKI